MFKYFKSRFSVAYLVVLIVVSSSMTAVAQFSIPPNEKCCMVGVVSSPTPTTSGCVSSAGYCYSSGGCAGNVTSTYQPGLCLNSAVPTDTCITPVPKTYNLPIYYSTCGKVGDICVCQQFLAGYSMVTNPNDCMGSICTSTP